MAQTTTERAHGMERRRSPRTSSPAVSTRLSHSISPARPEAIHSAKRLLDSTIGNGSFGRNSGDACEIESRLPDLLFDPLAVCTVQLPCVATDRLSRARGTRRYRSATQYD